MVTFYKLLQIKPETEISRISWPSSYSLIIMVLHIIKEHGQLTLVIDRNRRQNTQLLTHQQPSSPLFFNFCFILVCQLIWFVYTLVSLPAEQTHLKKSSAQCFDGDIFRWLFQRLLLTSTHSWNICFLDEGWMTRTWYLKLISWWSACLMQATELWV